MEYIQMNDDRPRVSVTSNAQTHSSSPRILKVLSVGSPKQPTVIRWQTKTTTRTLEHVEKASGEEHLSEGNILLEGKSNTVMKTSNTCPSGFKSISTGLVTNGWEHLLRSYPHFKSYVP